MNDGIHDIATEEFATHTTATDGAITVRLTGSAENDAMGALDAFLQTVHGGATKDKAPEVVVDLRSLEFMNSSCFKAFVTWFGLLREAPPDAQYRVRFLSDSKKRWQSRSLTAMKCFAVDLIHVDES